MWYVWVCALRCAACVCCAMIVNVILYVGTMLYVCIGAALYTYKRDFKNYRMCRQCHHFIRTNERMQQQQRSNEANDEAQRGKKKEEGRRKAANHQPVSAVLVEANANDEAEHRKKKEERKATISLCPLSWSPGPVF